MNEPDLDIGTIRVMAQWLAGPNQQELTFERRVYMQVVLEGIADKLEQKLDLRWTHLPNNGFVQDYTA